MNSSKVAPDPVSVPIHSRITPTAEQARALTGHASQRGIESEHIAILCGQISNLADSAALPCEALESYAKVSKLLAPVSGRSLVDSLNVDRHTRPVRMIACVVLVLTAASAILDGWFGDLPEPAEGLLLYLYQAHRHGLDFIAPFLWGALGSCVFLLKKYNDFAEARVFDIDCRQGWGTRILLGAILGGVVQYLYDSSIFTRSGLNLDASALGFLSGVGVKVVYGAIEKTIAALAEAMNLDSIKAAARPENAIRKFLAEALVQEQDEVRRNVLADLLKRLRE